MENIQHYRPLSYALHPATTSTTASSSSPGPVHLPPQPADDSSMVATTDAPSVASVAEGTPVSHDASSVTEPPAKRRPGRPKGSRVKKDSAKAVATPSLPEVNAQNQQYYEFQWRMLNLCAEFYGAAEELVKSTPPLVIAQCYQMGPGTPMDPLVMLTEAKRTCDTLLANPSELLTMPPPPMYPAMPAFYQPPPIVVANPAPYPLPMAPSYAHYPAAYYHPYPYAAPPPPPPPQASASAPAPGAWSDEEVERLRKLAEDSKTRNTTAEPDWDWVVGQWGHSRSRCVPELPLFRCFLRLSGNKSS
ncbi:unnamed protein product [Mycena citricolor]|uniref:Uncharacterized protein n=1 Tax=Mycena citricolor TaxID=2018698 RepID=A0AAD2HGA3_9AGAR|nr:unnamed protein product [Mycena citricolor]